MSGSRLIDAISMTPAAAHLHDTRSVLAPGQDAPLDLTILVTCYNEESFIIATIETVRAALLEAGGISYELIIIDDCSSDSSVALIESYIREHPDERILLRQNKINRGLAQNYVDAAFIGKGKYYRLICGDDAEPKDTMVTVFREIGKADMIVPYYVTAEGKSGYRQFLSKAFTALVNTIGGFKLQYYNGLAVHLRYNVMRWHPNTRGFGFQPTSSACCSSTNLHTRRCLSAPSSARAPIQRHSHSKTCSRLPIRSWISSSAASQTGSTAGCKGRLLCDPYRSGPGPLRLPSSAAILR
jgi:hypothetical protein